MHTNNERITEYFGRKTRRDHNLLYLKLQPKGKNINIRQKTQEHGLNFVA
jgi:hypothetical protein